MSLFTRMYIDKTWFALRQRNHSSRSLTTSNSIDAPSQPSATVPARGLKHVFKEYGPVGFITYSSISLVSYPSWVAAIYFGVDVTPITSKMNDLKQWWASTTSQSDDQPLYTDMPSTEPCTSDWYTTVGTTLLVAMTGHKIIFPLRAGLTMFLTPSVARFMRANNLEFWMKTKPTVKS
ncbi:DUF1279 superfamily [Batrachochytrium dendrobatidis]